MALAVSSAVGHGAAIVWGWCHTVVHYIWRAPGSEADVPSSFITLFFHKEWKFFVKEKKLRMWYFAIGPQKPASMMHWSEEIQLYCTPNNLVLITVSLIDLPARGMAGRKGEAAGRRILFAALSFSEKRWDRNRTQVFLAGTNARTHLLHIVEFSILPGLHLACNTVVCPPLI